MVYLHRVNSLDSIGCLCNLNQHNP